MSLHWWMLILLDEQETRNNSFINNKSRVYIMHSRAKHIEIKHHFIRDHVQKAILELQFVSTKDHLVNLFTKPLTKDGLILLLERLGILPVERSFIPM